MKLSKIIKFFEEQKKAIGDVEVYEVIELDHVTFSIPFQPKKLVYHTIWETHPDPKR